MKRQAFCSFVRVLMVGGILISAPAWSAPKAASASDSKFGVSGPIGFVESQFGWGGLLDYVFEVAPNWYVGGEVGAFYFNKSVGVADKHLWIFPLLPTAFYFFDLPTVPAVTPFISGSFGASLVKGSIQESDKKGDDTTGKLHVQVAGGAVFGNSQSYFFSTRLGLISDAFYVAPSVGIFF